MHGRTGWLAAVALLGAAGLVAQDDGIEAKKAGAKFTLGGKPVEVERMEILPLVENDFSRRFKYDQADNPKLKQLREQEKLDAVVAAGKDEFEKQVLLLDWAYRRMKKFGKPTAQPKGALEILRDNDAGHTFFCAHYAQLLVSAGASMGWIVRPMGLKRPDGRGKGSTEHSITEIWSNQHRKWVMFDPTYALYCEKDGVPLNAWEIRQEWFYHGDGKDLTFVLGTGPEQKRHTVKDLPVFKGTFPGFGRLELTPNTLHKYAFLAYTPNTALMDSPLDYGNMFITQDALCEGTKWHKRANPADPAHEPYFPLGQAALSLRPGQGAALVVSAKTMTPNFKAFQSRVDGKEWQDCQESFSWPLHAGSNLLEVRSVNQFGVSGPVSTVGLKR